MRSPQEQVRLHRRLLADALATITAASTCKSPGVPARGGVTTLYARAFNPASTTTADLAAAAA